VGSIITMVATSTGGSESALAAIDVPREGRLQGASWAVRSSFDTTADFQTFELSFGSALVTTNDSRQIVSVCTVGQMVVGAAGIMLALANYMDILPEILVGAGERLFLHSHAAANVVGVAFCTLHFDFELDLPRVRRR
jgi:hypothetical protein